MTKPLDITSTSTQIDQGETATAEPAVEPYWKIGLGIANRDSALANVSVDQILQDLENGKGISVQASEHGVTAAGIYRKLLAHAPERWKAAQAAQALAKLEDTENGLGVAQTGVEVNRAAQLWRLQAWKLERVARSIYGDQQTLTLNINIGDVTERIAELERELGLITVDKPVIEHDPQPDLG
jgi:hypothetical protein